jgi:group II intron reverse transcriptase/maturase
VDWINPTGAKKVHSLIDKVHKRKNLEMAWESVHANRGSGGVDGQSLSGFAKQLEQQLNRLQCELQGDSYQPQPVRQVQIPKAGKPGEYRTLGIPTIYDRVCQQALLNRLEPIFEPVFDEANFGYRRGRSTKDALRKVWKEIQSGSERIVDADLKDFFGSVDHEKFLTLVAQRVADSRVLRLIQAMLKAGSYGKGRLFPSERGAPQGAVVSPLLSNILLTPFDRERRRKGYQLTRYADDWVITCKSAAEARAAVAVALRILRELGVELHPKKTRIVHVHAEDRKRRGEGKPETFNFLGFTHICAKNRKTGGFSVDRKTIRKRLSAKLKAVREELRRRWHEPVAEVGKWLRSVVQGYFNYHAVPGNIDSLQRFRAQVVWHWSRALQRRSQKSRMPWERFGPLVARWIPSAVILHPRPAMRFNAKYLR